MSNRIACFKDGKLDKEWVSLIHPEIESMLSRIVCVSHRHFDRISLDKVIRKYSLEPIEFTWLDSANAARRTWDECALKGYGLANVCKIIGYEFKHHDAFEDAKASGAIINAAIEKAGITLKEWCRRPAYRAPFLLVRFLWASKENELALR